MYISSLYRNITYCIVYRKFLTTMNRMLNTPIEGSNNSYRLILKKTRIKKLSISRVIPLSVRDILLGWHGSFVCKRRKKVWNVGLLCIFWTVWKVRNGIAFDGSELLLQRLKNSFVCFLWSKTRMFINNAPFNSFKFFRLDGILLRVVLLKSFFFCSFGFWCCHLMIGVNVPYTVGHSFGGPF